MQSNKDNKSHDKNVSNPTPTVSVIMNCLNSEEYLREAIDSVFAQTYEDWEIIFWNDKASSDRCGEIAKSYSDKLRYFRGEVSLPLYGAKNLALEKARGKYIAFLDCDDRWIPDKLELQVKEFEKNKNLGLIYTNVNILEFNSSPRTKYNKPQTSGRIFRQLLEKYIINLQTVMISRKALDRQDYGFDKRMFFSGDADLFLRIAYKEDVLYIPRVLAEYREHGTNMSVNRLNDMLIDSERILNNLSKLIDNFTTEYKSEISKFKFRILLSVIISKWKYADGIEVRKFIVKNLSSSHWLKLFYILSFLPFKVVNSIRTRLPI